MNGPTTVTSAQTVSPWTDVGGMLAPKVILYNSSGDVAHVILEAAEIVTNGSAESSEVLYPNIDISASAGTNTTLIVYPNRYRFLRLSASSPTSAIVYGGIN